MNIKIFNKSMINVVIQGIKIPPMKTSPDIDVSESELNKFRTRRDITIMHQDKE